MPPRKISPNEPAGELARVPVRECGEPLVDFLKACPGLILAQPIFEYTRATLVRQGVAERLNQAMAALPKGFRLGIVEGWRPMYVQRRMWLTSWIRFQNLHPEWSEVQRKRVVNRFVAPPDAKAAPPHSTGGAVDVYLVDESGERLDHSSPFEVFDPKNYPAHVKGLSETAQRHRRILREAMLEGGLTNYPSEWWHWSYGDQGWAYRGGEPHAVYGRIAHPEGWEPIAEDEVDEPLVRLRAGGERSGFPKVREP
jgi:zinc D-Ala-D-Ala dipeptidase